MIARTATSSRSTVAGALLVLMPAVSLWARAAAAEEARVAVVIGSNVGVGDDEPLDYAENDARRFHQLLATLGGVRRDRALLVVGANAAQARQALSEAAGRLLELGKRGPTALVVYVSAHADSRALHLSGTRLPLDELQRRVRATGAKLRLTIIDACRTPARSRQRGGRAGPHVALALHRGARVEGDITLTSTGAGEPAQEWVFLRGGLFTHHLMSALRGAGDVDGDRRVSLTEAYSYAFRRTSSASARRVGRVQHPSFDMAMSGFGDWPFTQLSRLRATIVLSRELEGRFWIANRQQDLVAELDKRAGEEARIAVEPGWHRVVQPRAPWALVADVNLGWGGERRLVERDFARIRLRRETLRGPAPIVLRPWRVGAGYALCRGLVEGLGLQHLAAIELGRFWGNWLARGRVAAGYGSFLGQRLKVNHYALQLALGGGHSWPVHIFTISGGLEARLDLVRQTIAREDQEQIARVFGKTDAPRVAAVWGAAAFAGIAIPLSDTFWAQVAGSAGVAVVPLAEQKSVVAVGEGRLLLQWAF